jgi:cysteine synthase A
MNYATDVTELVGNTPMVKINSLDNYNNLILAKCEFMNPTSSVKDRIALNMINKAFENKLIDQDTTIIEPTSGNTGIGLAMVCASKGLKLILTMPSSMSIERRKILKALGAKLELSDPAKGMKGAIAMAEDLSKNIDNSYIPQQFENNDNPNIHKNTTAQEILKDTDGKIDIFVSAVGTGGTITGVGKVLLEHNPNVQIIAVEPENSAVLSGGKPSSHKIQGIGAGFIPKILDVTLFTEIITISNEEAFEASRNIAKKEGLLLGISSGANLSAVQKIAKREENKGKVIVTILCDTGERYLSTELFPQ